jgi:O-antigen ligase
MRDILSLEHKWVSWLSWGVLLVSALSFAYTSNPVYIGVPFAFLFLLLTGVNWKTAFWVLLFSIPLSIDFSFFNKSLSTSVPDEPMMWLFLLLLMFLIAKKPSSITREWVSNPIVTIITLQFLWMIVAVCCSRMHLVSVKFMFAKLWFLASFFIIPQFIFTDKKDFKRGFLLLVIPVYGTVLWVFARHALLGFSFRRIEKAIGDIYFNHVDYSTVMSMIYPLLWVAVPLTKGKNPVLRGILWTAIIFMLPAIYFTYARAAILAVVFSIVLGITIRYKLAHLIMPAFYGVIALAMVYMINDNKYVDFRPDYQHTFMRKKFIDHIVATFRGQDMSSMERLYRWVAAVRMSKDEPIKGYGPNTFYYYYKPYGVPMFKTYVSRNFEKSTSHNYFLYMLVEQGWPAMLLYAALVLVVIAQAQKTYHRFKDRFYKYCTLGVAMMFGAGFINNFFSELIETHKVGSLFYLSVALIVILSMKSKQMEKENELAVS